MPRLELGDCALAGEFPPAMNKRVAVRSKQKMESVTRSLRINANHQCSKWITSSASRLPPGRAAGSRAAGSAG